MNGILVTPRSLTTGHHSALDRIAGAGYRLVLGPAGRLPDEDDRLALLPGCVGWLAGIERISARVLEAVPSLRVISRNGTGTDAIDLAAAARSGVRVLRAEGANANGVAELAVALMLAAARSVPEQAASPCGGAWRRCQGLELAGRTVGLVGCGAIGRRLARILTGFGAEVLGFDLCPDRQFFPGSGFAWAALDQVLARADIVSLHCPPPADGRPLLDAAALEGGRLGWYATDVFRTEPPGLILLLSHPRVVATPHVGGFAAESVARATSAAVDNLLAALAAPAGGLSRAG